MSKKYSDDFDFETVKAAMTPELFEEFLKNIIWGLETQIEVLIEEIQYLKEKK